MCISFIFLQKSYIYIYTYFFNMVRDTINPGPVERNEPHFNLKIILFHNLFQKIFKTIVNCMLLVLNSLLLSQNMQGRVLYNFYMAIQDIFCDCDLISDEVRDRRLYKPAFLANLLGRIAFQLALFCILYLLSITKCSCGDFVSLLVNK